MNPHRSSWLVRAAAVLLTTAALAASPVAVAAQDTNPTIDPATGEPPGAPVGCCCYPKVDSPAGQPPSCKPNVTEFDCKAECAELRDGRLPSGCQWTPGACKE